MRRSKVVAIFGRKGSGKTYLMRQMSKNEDRIIIFDITNEFFGGFIYLNPEIFFSAIEDIFERENFRIVLKFQDITDYEKTIDFLWENDFREYSLYVDEVHLLASPVSMSENFRNMFALSRHKNINLVVASQRPYRVNPIIRSQADQIITFRQTEKRDLQLLSELGFATEEVASLPDHKYISQEI